MQKAEREVEEFRKYQQLTREFLGTNTEICRLRPLEGEVETELKKNDRSDPTRDHARSRAVLASRVRRATQDGATGLEATEMECARLYTGQVPRRRDNYSNSQHTPRKGARGLAIEADQPTIASGAASPC